MFQPAVDALSQVFHKPYVLYQLLLSSVGSLGAHLCRTRRRPSREVYIMTKREKYNEDWMEEVMFASSRTKKFMFTKVYKGKERRI